MTYLQRALRETVDLQDWESAQRILDLSSHLDFSGSVRAVDQVGVRRLVTALQKRNAGEIETAVYQYLFALQSGSTLLPAEQIGQDLESLRKLDPARYQAGVRQAVNAAFVQSLIYHYKAYGFASFLIPLGEQHETPGREQPGRSSLVIEAPALH